jgi:hypothetical protein
MTGQLLNIINKYLQVMGKTMEKPLKGRRLAFKPTQLQHRCTAVSNSAKVGCCFKRA